ncbi:MAG: acetyl-CoA carboxylase biotin carboxyl carrier protein subunit [Burkholderiales bacterium]|nr:acetyl-CoA carboxylase biotin carboxyl carrier protein subunit [Burkholderiales bacterium]
MTDPKIDLAGQLTRWLADTDITLLELSGPGQLIRLRRNGQAVSVDNEPAAVEAAPTSTVVKAGSVGILLLSHPLRGDPLVQVGQQVAKGQAIALLNIGLVLLPVAAPRAGIVQRIVAAHESTVGYGEPLIELH